MQSDYYAQLVKRYAPLISDGDHEMSEAEKQRTHEIVKWVMGQSGENGITCDDAVYNEACRLINEEGLIVACEPKRLTQSFVDRVAVDEAQALVSAAAVVVAQRETERRKPFSDELLNEIMIKAMNELYIGKKQILLTERSGSNFNR